MIQQTQKKKNEKNKTKNSLSNICDAILPIFNRNTFFSFIRSLFYCDIALITDGHLMMCTIDDAIFHPKIKKLYTDSVM